MAKLATVNRGPQGRNTAQEFNVEGPVTVTNPTVRNKLDTQLQTRILVAELEDYEGRVADVPPPRQVAQRELCGQLAGEPVVQPPTPA